MFSANMRKVADKLITKYGSTVILGEVAYGEFDPNLGERDEIVTPHEIKAHLSSYKSSDIIPDVINIDDIKVLLYADNFKINKGWKLYYNNKTYKILNATIVGVQDMRITYELQCRGVQRNV